MLWADLAIVFFLALMFTLILAAFRGRGYGDWAGVVWFFLLMFFATWALGVWFRPIGPLVWGADGLAFLVVAMIVALVVAAALAPAPPASRAPGPAERPAGPGPETVAAEPQRFGVFFWILLAAAVVAIVSAYWTAW